MDKASKLPKQIIRIILYSVGLGSLSAVIYLAGPLIAFGDWHLRFFAKNVGSSSGDLRVQVIVPSLLGTRAVAFRFTPVGYGAAYQIDDVYLDPWKDT